MKLILIFQAAGINVQPIETTYTYLNPELKKVYVIDWKWVDSLGLKGVFDTTGIKSVNLVEDTNSLSPVKLTNLEIK